MTENWKDLETPGWTFRVVFRFDHSTCQSHKSQQCQRGWYHSPQPDWKSYEVHCPWIPGNPREVGSPKPKSQTPLETHLVGPPSPAHHCMSIHNDLIFYIQRCIQTNISKKRGERDRERDLLPWPEERKLKRVEGWRRKGNTRWRAKRVEISCGNCWVWESHNYHWWKEENLGTRIGSVFWLCHMWWQFGGLR